MKLLKDGTVISHQEFNPLGYKSNVLEVAYKAKCGSHLLIQKRLEIEVLDTDLIGLLQI